MTTFIKSPARDSAPRLILQTFPVDGQSILTNVDRAVVILAFINTYTASSISPEDFELVNSVYDTMSDYPNVLPDLEKLLVKVVMEAASSPQCRTHNKEDEDKLNGFIEDLYCGLVEDVMESDVYA